MADRAMQEMLEHMTCTTKGIKPNLVSFVAVAAAKSSLCFSMHDNDRFLYVCISQFP